MTDLSEILLNAVTLFIIVTKFILRNLNIYIYKVHKPSPHRR